MLALAGHLIDVLIWAIAFVSCGEFATFAEAMLYSGGNYTTLGSGLVVSDRWRLLAQLESADGLLMSGLSTVLLLGVIQRMIEARLTREPQVEPR